MGHGGKGRKGKTVTKQATASSSSACMPCRHLDFAMGPWEATEVF